MPEVFSLAIGKDRVTSVRASSADGLETSGFFLAASRLAFTASLLNSVVPNEKKTCGTKGSLIGILVKILQSDWVRHDTVSAILVHHYIFFDFNWLNLVASQLSSEESHY